MILKIGQKVSFTSGQIENIVMKRVCYCFVV